MTRLVRRGAHGVEFSAVGYAHVTMADATSEG